MKTFTIQQLKTHFVGIPYSSQCVFYTFLVKYDVIRKVKRGKYSYNFNALDNKLNIECVIEECRNYVNNARPKS